MHKLVLLRHGESTWNKENRFTGWTDVDLTEKGRDEARQAGRLLKEGGFGFDIPRRSLEALRLAVQGATVPVLAIGGVDGCVRGQLAHSAECAVLARWHGLGACLAAPAEYAQPEQ